MIHVEVRFFGGQHLFTQRMPPEVERALPIVSLPEGATVEDLLRTLSIATCAGRPFVSINRFLERDNVTLAEGDKIQLLTTVIGG